MIHERNRVDRPYLQVQAKQVIIAGCPRSRDSGGRTFKVELGRAIRGDETVEVPTSRSGDLRSGHVTVRPKNKRRLVYERLCWPLRYSIEYQTDRRLHALIE
jgi:hypothetical protein